jgi:hypothetical protein
MEEEYDEEYDDDFEEQWMDEDEYLAKRARSTKLMKFFILLFFIVPFVMVGISVIFILTDFELSHKLWFSGFIAFVAGLISYIIYAYGDKLEMAKIPSAALFASGVVMFYLALWFMPTAPETESRKILGIVLITIILIIILILLIYLFVKGEREKSPPQMGRRSLTRRMRPPVKVMRKKRG